MKILTVLGTRPEIIRLSRIIPLLDRHSKHMLVHTGQNYDYELNEVFFEDLGVRRPDEFLEVKSSSFGGQVGKIFERGQALLERQRPDRILTLGDTNSALLAFVAKRLGIPVFHMEAGNRCHDDRVPEEVNRRVIDHCSDVLMPYTQNSKQYLLAEGIAGKRIFVTGNPIFEVLESHQDAIDRSTVLTDLQLDRRKYFLVTAHREENVDVAERLRGIFDGLLRVARRYRWPVIVSVHPRTRKRIEQFDIETEDEDIRLVPPLGFFDFVHLEKHAGCVLSDSGTVQEECCLMRVANVTLRDSTERPETIECGSNILSGVGGADIEQAVELAMGRDRNWTPPGEYLIPDVSHTVLNILLGAHGNREV